MPGPITHIIKSIENANTENLSGEQLYQRVLGAIIPDTPVIEKRAHSIMLKDNGKYINLLKGIREHASTDRVYHKKLDGMFFGHELWEIYDDFRLLCKEDGERERFCDLVFRSIDYGRRNITLISSMISEKCGTDYEETKEGLEKYLDVVKGYVRFLRRSTTLLGGLSSFTS